MLKPDEITQGLSNFHGTEKYHRFSILFPKMVLTDGAKWLGDNAECFWLFDAIASHQKQAMKDPMLKEMQFWTLKVNSDKTATLICERDTDDVAITQKIEHTDFPLEEIKIWVAPSGDENSYTLYLPSEH